MVQAQFDKLAYYIDKPRDQHALTKNYDQFVGGSHVHPGIWRWGASQGVIGIVNFESTIPGGQEGESFVAFSDPGVGLDGTAAFVGLGNAGTYGLFKGNRNTALKLVVSKQLRCLGTTVPPFRISRMFLQLVLVERSCSLGQ